MPMNMIWVSRNQDELVNDVDLAKLKDISWNEFIKKRYLPAITSGQSPACTASSMLDIVRDMNLQRRRFQIMGLHEQVEASEIQLVLHLCQARILHPTANTHGEYRSLANRFRRHDRFYEAFALAVGAFVCSSAPFTLGAATTRYERDLQYEYKKHTTALFVYVLQQHPGAVGEAGIYDEDYVLRISRLIVVWPSDGGGGGACSGPCDGGLPPSFPEVPPPSHKSSVTNESLLGAAVAAQTMAEKAEFSVGKVDRALRAELDKVKSEFRTGIASLNDNLLKEEKKREVACKLEGEARVILQHSITEHVDQLLIGWLSTGRPGGGDGGRGDGLDTFFQKLREGLQSYLDGKFTEKLSEIDGARTRTLQTADEIRDLGGDLRTRLQESTNEIKRMESGLTQRIAEVTQGVDINLTHIVGEIRNLYGILGTIARGGGAAPASDVQMGDGEVSDIQADLSNVKNIVGVWARNVDTQLDRLVTLSDENKNELEKKTGEISEKLNAQTNELETFKKEESVSIEKLSKKLSSTDIRFDEIETDNAIQEKHISSIGRWMGYFKDDAWIDDESRNTIFTYDDTIQMLHEGIEEIDEKFKNFRETEDQMIQRRNESFFEYVQEHYEPTVREIVKNVINAAPNPPSPSKRRRNSEDGIAEEETLPRDVSDDPTFISTVARNVTGDRQFVEYIEGVIRSAIAQTPVAPASAVAAEGRPTVAAGDEELGRRLDHVERALRRMQGTEDPGYREVAEQQLSNASFGVAPQPPPP